MDNKKKKLIVKRAIVLIVLALIIFLIVLGIFKIINFFSPEKVAGNYSNNNMGLAVQDGNTTYYNKYDKGIFKVENGKETEINNNQTAYSAYSITLVDDTIYYLTVSNSGTIDLNSIKTNGEDFKTIKTLYTSSTKFYIKDGFAYYISNKDQTGINKISLDNGEETTIFSSNIQDFIVENDKIYYTNSVGFLYTIDIDGNNQKEISSEYNMKNIQKLGNWIYFYNENENALCKIKKNGKSKTTVATFVNNEMYNVTNKHIYYFDQINKTICRSDLKGKKSKVVVSLEASRTKINIANGIIYYLDNSKVESQIYQMFRIKENGREAKPIEY